MYVAKLAPPDVENGVRLKISHHLSRERIDVRTVVAFTFLSDDSVPTLSSLFRARRLSRDSWALIGPREKWKEESQKSKVEQDTGGSLSRRGR